MLLGILPTDLLKEIVVYLELEDLGKLYATLNRRLQLSLSVPHVIKELSIQSTHDWTLLAPLLRSLKPNSISKLILNFSELGCPSWLPLIHHLSPDSLSVSGRMLSVLVTHNVVFGTELDKLKNLSSTSRSSSISTLTPSSINMNIDDSNIDSPHLHTPPSSSTPAVTERKLFTDLSRNSPGLNASLWVSRYLPTVPVSDKYFSHRVVDFGSMFPRLKALEVHDDISRLLYIEQYEHSCHFVYLNIVEAASGWTLKESDRYNYRVPKGKKNLSQHFAKSDLKDVAFDSTYGYYKKYYDYCKACKSSGTKGIYDPSHRKAQELDSSLTLLELSYHPFFKSLPKSLESFTLEQSNSSSFPSHLGLEHLPSSLTKLSISNKITAAPDLTMSPLLPLTPISKNLPNLITLSLINPTVIILPPKDATLSENLTSLELFIPRNLMFGSMKSIPLPATLSSLTIRSSPLPNLSETPYRIFGRGKFFEVLPPSLCSLIVDSHVTLTVLPDPVPVKPNEPMAVDLPIDFIPIPSSLTCLALSIADYNVELWNRTPSLPNLTHFTVNVDAELGHMMKHDMACALDEDVESRLPLSLCRFMPSLVHMDFQCLDLSSRDSIIPRAFDFAIFDTEHTRVMKEVSESLSLPSSLRSLVVGTIGLTTLTVIKANLPSCTVIVRGPVIVTRVDLARLLQSERLMLKLGLPSADHLWEDYISTLFTHELAYMGIHGVAVVSDDELGSDDSSVFSQMFQSLPFPPGVTSLSNRLKSGKLEPDLRIFHLPKDIYGRDVKINRFNLSQLTDPRFVIATSLQTLTISGDLAPRPRILEDICDGNPYYDDVPIPFPSYPVSFMINRNLIHMLSMHCRQLSSLTLTQVSLSNLDLAYLPPTLTSFSAFRPHGAPPHWSKPIPKSQLQHLNTPDVMFTFETLRRSAPSTLKTLFFYYDPTGFMPHDSELYQFIYFFKEAAIEITSERPFTATCHHMLPTSNVLDKVTASKDTYAQLRALSGDRLTITRVKSPYIKPWDGMKEEEFDDRDLFYFFMKQLPSMDFFPPTLTKIDFTGRVVPETHGLWIAALGKYCPTLKYLELVIHPKLNSQLFNFLPRSLEEIVIRNRKITVWDIRNGESSASAFQTQPFVNLPPKLITAKLPFDPKDSSNFIHATLASLHIPGISGTVTDSIALNIAKRMNNGKGGTINCQRLMLTGSVLPQTSSNTLVNITWESLRAATKLALMPHVICSDLEVYPRAPLVLPPNIRAVVLKAQDRPETRADVALLESNADNLFVLGPTTGLPPIIFPNLNNLHSLTEIEVSFTPSPFQYTSHSFGRVGLPSLVSLTRLVDRSTLYVDTIAREMLPPKLQTLILPLVFNLANKKEANITLPPSLTFLDLGKLRLSKDSVINLPFGIKSLKCGDQVKAWEWLKLRKTTPNVANFPVQSPSSQRPANPPSVPKTSQVPSVNSYNPFVVDDEVDWDSMMDVTYQPGPTLTANDLKSIRFKVPNAPKASTKPSNRVETAQAHPEARTSKRKRTARKTRYYY